MDFIRFTKNAKGDTNEALTLVSFTTRLISSLKRADRLR